MAVQTQVAAELASSVLEQAHVPIVSDLQHASAVSTVAHHVTAAPDHVQTSAASEPVQAITPADALAP
eukprot:2357470-Amphidinium_carterae.1